MTSAGSVPWACSRCVTVKVPRPNPAVLCSLGHYSTTSIGRRSAEKKALRCVVRHGDHCWSEGEQKQLKEIRNKYISRNILIISLHLCTLGKHMQLNSFVRGI